METTRIEVAHPSSSPMSIQNKFKNFYNRLGNNLKTIKALKITASHNGKYRIYCRGVPSLHSWETVVMYGYELLAQFAQRFQLLFFNVYHGRSQWQNLRRCKTEIVTSIRC